jgi:transposase-like protein
MKNGLTSTTSSRGLVYMPEQREVVPSPQSPPNPEVLARPKRRRFSQDYKHRIVQEAAACAEPGQIGALLRREGLYSSHLVDWRRQEQSANGVAKPANVQMAEQNRRLRRENERLQRRLAQAEVVIDIQKKVSELLGISLKSPESDGND